MAARLLAFGLGTPRNIRLSVSRDASGPAPSRSTPVCDGVLLRPPRALPDNLELSLKDPSYVP